MLVLELIVRGALLLIGLVLGFLGGRAWARQPCERCAARDRLLRKLKRRSALMAAGG